MGVTKIPSNILCLNTYNETNTCSWATSMLFLDISMLFHKIQCLVEVGTASLVLTPATAALSGLCALCLGSSLGPCAQCKFCKGGAAGCKKLCNKGKNTSTCKTCIQRCS